MRRKEQYIFVIDYFSRHLPDAQTELHYRNPYELLVSVVLSAQCTDKRVNEVTPALFQAFPDLKTMAQARADEVFPYIRSISYPNSKAKYLSELAKKIETEFKGILPNTRDALQSLPGVGRKTANVILSVLYHNPNMAVDTHVYRVARRIGLVSLSDNTPLKVEKKLLEYLPKNIVYKAHHWLILHGRYTCTARNPKCAVCGLQSICRDFKQRGK